MDVRRPGFSLDNILERYSLTRDQLDTPCTFKDCANVARILLQWEHLAPYIGLEEVDITRIQHDHLRDYSAQCLAAIAKWRRKNGENATFLNLAEGLWTIGYVDQVEKLCEIVIARESCTDHNSPRNSK